MTEFGQESTSAASVSGADEDPITNRIVKIIVDYLVEDPNDAAARHELERSVRAGANLWRELHADSLRVVEICMDLEKDFDILILDEEFPETEITLSLCVDLVREKLAARASTSAGGK